jgi:hypothetical protein
VRSEAEKESYDSRVRSEACARAGYANRIRSEKEKKREHYKLQKLYQTGWRYIVQLY